MEGRQRLQEEQHIVKGVRKMIEKILRDYLMLALSVDVYIDRHDASGEYVVIEKTGSGRTNLIDSATVAIQSYADSMFNAATLNQNVKTAMYNAVSLSEIASVKLNSDYNYTDTTTKKYRYQAVFDVVYYGG